MPLLSHTAAVKHCISFTEQQKHDVYKSAEKDCVHKKASEKSLNTYSLTALHIFKGLHRHE